MGYISSVSLPSPNGRKLSYFQVNLQIQSMLRLLLFQVFKLVKEGLNILFWEFSYTRGNWTSEKKGNLGLSYSVTCVSMGWDGNHLVWLLVYFHCIHWDVMILWTLVSNPCRSIHVGLFLPRFPLLIFSHCKPSSPTINSLLSASSNLP